MASFTLTWEILRCTEKGLLIFLWSFNTVQGEISNVNTLFGWQKMKLFSISAACKFSFLKTAIKLRGPLLKGHLILQKCATTMFKNDEDQTFSFVFICMKFCHSALQFLSLAGWVLLNKTGMKKNYENIPYFTEKFFFLFLKCCWTDGLQHLILWDLRAFRSSQLC